jgi:Flp pilus assembly pilin Flp
MSRLLCRLLKSEDGSAVVEYAVLLGVLVALLVGAAAAIDAAAEGQFRSTGGTVGTYGVP